jgi:hypothetical protein
MSRFALALVLSVVLLGCAATVLATTVVVPDDFATIQQAIDSGAGTVEIRAGLYDERLILDRPVNLVAKIGTYGTATPYFNLPRIRSAFVGHVTSDYEAPNRIDGIWFLGDVTTRTGYSGDFAMAFFGCRFDSGMTSNAWGASHLRYQACTFFAGLDISTYSYEVVGSTFVHCGLRAFYDGYGLVEGNVVLGPTPVGMYLYDSAGALLIEDNHVDGAGVGFSVQGGHLERNTARNCLEQGFLLTGDAHTYVNCAGNRALACGGSGFRIEGANGRIVGNVAGRCGGPGFEFAPPLAQRSPAVAFRGDRIIRGNASYMNHGAGFQLTTSAYSPSDSLDHNIGFGGEGFGLELVGTESVPYGCNDWYRNAAGDVNGGVPDPSDLAVDPMFCNIAADSVTLRSTSPLVDVPGCGRIGADSVGCVDGTTGTRTPGGPPAEAANLRLELSPPSPNPTGHATRLSFSLPSAMLVRLSILDVQGREIARLLDGEQAAGRHEIAWTGARAGAYFVRLEAGNNQLVRRAFVLR